MRCGLVSLLFAAALCNAQTPAQDRATQFKALADGFRLGGPTFATLTQQDIDDRLAAMRRIIQREILETLNRTDKPEDVREVVENLVEKGWFGDTGMPFVYASSLQG